MSHGVPAELEQVLDVLRQTRGDARAIGVEWVGVVGSLARGDASQRSDIDLVYDARRTGYLWALTGLAADLEDRLNRRIDLVDRRQLPPERWGWMSRDLVAL